MATTPPKLRCYLDNVAAATSKIVYLTPVATDACITALPLRPPYVVKPEPSPKRPQKTWPTPRMSRR